MKLELRISEPALLARRQPRPDLWPIVLLGCVLVPGYADRDLVQAVRSN